MIDLRIIKDPSILVIGNHPVIIQSMLDYDFLLKRKPSICAIVAGGKQYAKYFYGESEILLPVFLSVEEAKAYKKTINLCLVVTSARRVLEVVEESFAFFPNLSGGVIFAEGMPEKQALMLSRLALERKKWLIGPASVGVIVPGVFKLGAIGGVEYNQLLSSRLMTPGSVAVFSASGGMTNEILRIVTSSKQRVSFSIHVGGDLFPCLTPEQAMLMAESDPNTKSIVYYGELGGYDEYEIAKLLKNKKLTKPLICYIAGSVSDLFITPPQFGHAKAIAGNRGESATEKKQALRLAGAKVADSFQEFVSLIHESKADDTIIEEDYLSKLPVFTKRRKSLLTSSISGSKNGEAMILNQELLNFSSQHSFAYIVTSLFLGKEITSSETEHFVDFVLRLLVDHGPYVSGALNTIVTARAGRDMVSSLASGLLTIGPRFGGAINQAAGNWLSGVSIGLTPHDFVEEFAREKNYIPGIGHKKYRIDMPDPRVLRLLQFTDKLKYKTYTKFALSVESVTAVKKGNLILNIDGAIAAVMLDILSEKESLSPEELKKLVSYEFFNSLFVLSRSVGFIAHFLDQKRLDEGLFRLDEALVAKV